MFLARPSFRFQRAVLQADLPKPESWLLAFECQHYLFLSPRGGTKHFAMAVTALERRDGVRSHA